MKNAIQLISDERERQISKEGFSCDHDEHHDRSQLALAAAVYAIPSPQRLEMLFFEYLWPWDRVWYKPTSNDRIRELTKAGALIVAEIDRLQRLSRLSGNVGTS